MWAAPFFARLGREKWKYCLKLNHEGGFGCQDDECDRPRHVCVLCTKEGHGAFQRRGHNYNDPFICTFNEARFRERRVLKNDLRIFDDNAFELVFAKSVEILRAESVKHRPALKVHLLCQEVSRPARHVAPVALLTAPAAQVEVVSATAFFEQRLDQEVIEPFAADDCYENEDDFDLPLEELTIESHTLALEASRKNRLGGPHSDVFRATLYLLGDRANVEEVAVKLLMLDTGNADRTKQLIRAEYDALRKLAQHTIHVVRVVSVSLKTRLVFCVPFMSNHVCAGRYANRFYAMLVMKKAHTDLFRVR